MLMLNNRELAGLIWLGVGILWILSQKQVRKSAAELAMAFFRRQILFPVLAMLAWTGQALWVGLQLGLWNAALLKGTVLWTLGATGVLLFNCAKADSSEHFFRRTIGATVGVAVFIEFF